MPVQGSSSEIGGIDDAKQSVDLGGEGVGLLRTEFLFLGRDQAPTEDEQAAAWLFIHWEKPLRPLSAKKAAMER